MMDMIAERTRPAPTASIKSTVRRVLNTGSGPMSLGSLHEVFDPKSWREVRLDINPNVKPDIVGSSGDMRNLVEDASFDAVWSSHNIEHLHAFEVVPAFEEFRRVLKADGFAIITCPDIRAICQLVIDRGLDVPAYSSSAGPITPLDMLYGHGRSIRDGNTFMRHHSGFTEDTLGKVSLKAGFAEARVASGNGFDLWALLLMPKTDRAALRGILAPTPQSFLLDEA